MVTLLDLVEAQVSGVLQSEAGIFTNSPVRGRSPGLAFTPDSRLLAGTEGQTIRLWDVQARREVGSWPAHTVYGSITFSQDSRKLAFADKVIDTSSNLELFASPFGGRTGLTALSPDSTRLAVYDFP
jgi:WD40 repeat protein